MEVIKEGSVPEVVDWNTEVTCEKKDEHDTSGCGAVWKIKAEDLILMYWKGTHSYKHYTAIQCSRCKKYNRVFNVPPNVLEKVNTPRARKHAIFDGFGSEY